jgi:hypothetical protein
MDNLFPVTVLTGERDYEVAGKNPANRCKNLIVRGQRFPIEYTLNIGVARQIPNKKTEVILPLQERE